VGFGDWARRLDDRVLPAPSVPVRGSDESLRPFLARLYAHSYRHSLVLGPRGSVALIAMPAAALGTLIGLFLGIVRLNPFEYLWTSFTISFLAGLVAAILLLLARVLQRWWYPPARSRKRFRGGVRRRAGA
jgi:hypothetical protein